jgi:hypothetical protein
MPPAARRYKEQMKTPRILAGAVLSLGLLAGCAATTTTATQAPAMRTGAPSAPGGAASASDDVCAASANLKASVSDLTTLTMSDGLPGVQTKVQAIQTNLDAFQAAAKSEYGPQVAALRSALTNLQSALGALGASPGMAALAGVVPQVTAVITAWNGLQQAVSTRCG